MAYHVWPWLKCFLANVSNENFSVGARLLLGDGREGMKWRMKPEITLVVKLLFLDIVGLDPQKESHLLNATCK